MCATSNDRSYLTWKVANLSRIGSAASVLDIIFLCGPDIPVHRIAEMAEQDARTVRRHILELETEGIIETLRTPGQRNRYAVHISAAN